MVLVTGATGHIGNVLVRQLNSIGVKPKVLVLPKEDITSIKGLEFEIVTGDVLDTDSLNRAFNDVDVVFHLAGIITIMPGKNELVRKVNVEGTRNIINACFRHDVKRLIYTSSIHALKRIAHGKTMDESLPFDPNNPYGAYDSSKAEASILVQEAAKNGLDAVIVCPTGVIGPFDFRMSELGQLIFDCLRSKIQLYINGEYDFVDVRDVVSGIISAWKKGKSGATYILSGHRIQVKEYIDSIARLSQRKIATWKVPFGLAKLFSYFTPPYYKLFKVNPRFTPYSIEVLQSNCDITHQKATAELGYKVRPVEESLFEAIRWFESNKSKVAFGRIPIPIRMF